MNLKLHFNYHCLCPKGQLKKGTILAKDEDSAQALLLKKRYKVLHLQAAAPKALILPAKVPLSVLSHFARELSTLLQSGLPTLQAIEHIQKNTPNKSPLLPILQEVPAKLRMGKHLSAALSTAHKALGDVFVSNLLTGEASGALANNLADFANWAESLLEARGKLLHMLIYPGIVLVSATSLFLGLMIGVVPTLESLFITLAGPGQSLPSSLSFLLAISKALQTPFFWVFFSLIFATIGFLIVSQKTAIRSLRYRLLTALPLRKQVYLSENLELFRLLAFLTKGGTPLYEAVVLASNTLKSPRLQDLLFDVKQGLLKGEPLSQILTTVPLFKPQYIGLIDAAGKAGTLPETFLHLSQQTNNELQNSLKRALAWAEPLIILAVALMIGGIILAFMLPLLSVMDRLL